jgi:UDP-N-acetylglucosamine 2-epimerase (non-hydrolysing)
VTIRVLTVVGTRPEAIKMAPVVLRLKRDARFEARVCATAQHREMLDQALELFGIRPDRDLAVMSPGQDLFDVTARVLLRVRDVLREEKPDVVLVHGDTTSCFATALAAFYLDLPVGHVEAGLRTSDLRLPFPEEANRVLTDTLATEFFAPTERARGNLLREGIADARIHVTGNTVIDALLAVREKVRDRCCATYAESFGAELLALLEHWRGRIVLVTGHRRENFGAGIRELCCAIRDAAAAHTDWLFVFPVHMNPNVQQPVNALLGETPNVVLCAPLEYEPFVWLMNRCHVVLTDSGGIQEEAPALGKPVLVTREVTERPEAIEAGAARLVGTRRERVIGALEELLLDPARYRAMAQAHNPFGDGRAAERIVEVLARSFAPSRTALAASA